jgi:fumarate hydratase class II
MNTETRIEHDSLGDVQVPVDALYGAQTQRAIQNFQISGLRPRPAFIWSMAMIKRAAAEVNRDLGLLDGERALRPPRKSSMENGTISLWSIPFRRARVPVTT